MYSVMLFRSLCDIVLWDGGGNLKYEFVWYVDNCVDIDCGRGGWGWGWGWVYSVRL